MTTQTSKPLLRNIQFNSADEEIPRAIESEKALFSIILNTPDLFVDIVDKITATDFYEAQSQQAWRAISHLYTTGRPIDLVSVKAALEEMNLSSTPAFLYVVDCMNSFSSPLGLHQLVDDIKNTSMLRQVITTAYVFQERAKGKGSRAELLLPELEKDILKITDQTRDERPTDLGGILREIQEDIYSLKEGASKNYSTGFEKVDKAVGGFIPTQCWILGAYTGTGKTFLVTQLILNLLQQDCKVMLVSTEMDRKTVGERLIGNLSEIDALTLMTQALTPDEERRLGKAEEFLKSKQGNLVIYDNVWTTSEIRLKAKKMKASSGLNVLFVDFIQNLKGHDNIYERMSNAAIELQRLAQELKITVLVVSQVNQASAGWQSKEAIEYKGAGEIAAIADVGLWVTKDKEDETLRHLIIRKARHGKPGKFPIRFYFPGGKIVMATDKKGSPDMSLFNAGDIKSVDNDQIEL